MDINKAIRKQKRSYKAFMLSMCFIFFLLPVILVWLNELTFFFIIYLSILEMLILLALFANMNREYLKYENKGYKLLIKNGFISETISIVCEKVVLVHMEEKEGRSHLIMITSSNFRNKKIRAVSKEFLRRHAYIAQHYYTIKKYKPEEKYYYILITKGGYYKYELLYKMYKTCVKAFYTEETIHRIKEYMTTVKDL